MSENISKLKELLFEGEARTLAELQARIDAVASQEVRTRGELAGELKRLADAMPSEMKRLAAVIEHERTGIRRFAEMSERDRAELRRLAEQSSARLAEAAHRLDAVFERAGTTERLETSVAGIIDGALRKAEIDRHTELSHAIAPLVVRTIKTEIRNSTDDLAEALYPMTGRMVKAYVASAMKDLVEQINRRLEQNWFMLRLRSLTTGRPVGELALAEAQRVEVQEVYLIRRGSGELIGRWPKTGANGDPGRDQVMSGILTAINDFSSEAFKGEGSALRHIDLEASQVYLRASPAYLLAVRCNGTAHAAVENAIDEEFLAAIDRHAPVLAGEAVEAPGKGYDPLLAEMSKHLVERVDATQRSFADPLPGGGSPLKILGALVALPLIGWLCWTMLESYESGRVRDVAQRVVDISTEIKGYPVALTVAPWGRTLTLTGLAPSDPAREDVVKRMSDLLPGTDIRDQLSVVPTGGFDTRPQLAQVRGQIARLEADTTRIALMRTLARARLRLEQAMPDLALLHDNVDASGRRAVVDASAAVTRITDTLRNEQLKLGSRQGSGNDLTEAKDRLASLSGELAKINADVAGIISENARAAMPRGATSRGNVSDVAEDLAAHAERIGATTIAVHQAMLLGRKTPAVSAPSAHDALARWVQTNAVFFSNGTDYRNETRAKATIDEAARLMKAAKARVRVVGYTDEPGGAARNSTLSQERAARVQADLVDRGVPANLIVTLGRSQGPNISATTGPQSPNRRAAFELVFDGEDAE